MFKRVTKSDLRRLELIQNRLTNRANRRACKLFNLVRVFG